LNVEEIQNSTMLRMSILGNNRQKNAAFLNKHAETFLQRELDKKNFRAQKTIDFIDEQLALVSQSLSNSESSLEDFRSEGQILNLDYQAQQSFSRLEALQQQRTNLTIKGKYYQYLENYLDQVGENGSDLIAPSSLGIDDPLLSELIMELIQRYTERSEVMINSRRDNPFIANLESRIEITKNTIKESLSNVMQSNNMAMADLDERIADLSGKIRTIPESQRHLFNIERQFTLHDNLFTFLQNKKSDIEITKAGFTPVHEIIDPSNPSDGRLVSPKKRMTYYIAGFAGLLVPILLIFLYEFFNDRIRTNAQFILPTNDVPVIMFTSTLLEEGKTFASLNMAVGYASMGKKAVLLSFDLRKPKLFKYLETGVELGLSNYLSSDINVKDIIRKGPVDNLDILFSGQIPPNPAELLNSPRMQDLFDYLKSNYDIILVDTPPVGMVADSLLLVNYCNAIIYLVRHNRTPVKYLQQTLRNLKEKDIKNLNIVLNDIPPPGRFSAYNAYGYQYGYFEKEQS